MQGVNALAMHAQKCCMNLSEWQHNVYFVVKRKLSSNFLNCVQSDHWLCDCSDSGNQDYRGHSTPGVFQNRRFSRGYGSSSGYRAHGRNGMFALHFLNFVPFINYNTLPKHLHSNIA